MLEDLPQLPGLKSTALLGDLTLLGGDRAAAGQIYLEAWRLGETSALLGYLALEAATAPSSVLVALAEEVCEAVIEGRSGASSGEDLARLMVSAAALARGDASLAGFLSLLFTRALPGLSTPLMLRTLEAPSERWEAARSALWARLSAVEDVDERGHLIFKLHHMALSAPSADLAEEGALMDLAARGATGALLYLVLRRLDARAERGHPSPAPPRVEVAVARPEPPEFLIDLDASEFIELDLEEIELEIVEDDDEDFLTPRREEPAAGSREASLAEEDPVAPDDASKVLSFLKFLSSHVQDRRERAVFKNRYGDWLWSMGQLDEAAEAYESLSQEGPVPVSDLALERLQRLFVAQRRWDRASELALERAERCDDAALRLSLLVLSLSYLDNQGTASPEAWLHAAERVLGLEGHGRQLPAAPLTHAFELVEGALAQAGRWAQLNGLWGRAGVSAGSRRRSARLPDRSLEGLVLGWVYPEAVAAEGHGGALAGEGGAARRLSLVRAISERHPERALLVLSRSSAPGEGERILKAALMLEVSASFGDSFDQGRITSDALESLLGELEGARGSQGRELITLYVLRAELKRQGRALDALGLFERVMDDAEPPLRARLAALIGRDLLQEGKLDDALALAREAFELRPTEPAARALLGDAARATGDRQALSLLADYVDEETLARMLSPTPGFSERFEQGRALATRGSDGAREASGIFKALAQEVEGRATQAGLLRRAAELRWTSGGDPEEAVRLALEAVTARSGDRLAVGTALDILLSAGRYGAVVSLADRLGGIGDVPAEMGWRLLEAGREVAQGGDASVATALLGEALRALPMDNEEGVCEVLETLERLYDDIQDPWRWRDALERVLGQGRPVEVLAEANRRLGRVYEESLPDRELAIEHYRAALSGDRARGPALEALERLLSEAQRYGELAEILRARAATVSGAGSGEVARRGVYLEALARVLADRLGMPEEARAVLDEVLARAPRNLTALLKAAELDRALGRWESLVAQLESAARQVEEQGRRSKLYHEIGQVYEQLGQTNLALENYMVSFICDNRNTVTFGRLEQLYNRFGRWSELVGIYDVAIDAVRQEPGCGYEAEQLFARKSQVEFYHLERERSAALSLLEALRLNPGEERYARLLESIVGEDRAPELMAEAYRLQIEGLSERAEQRRPLMHQLALSYERLGNMQGEAIEVYRRLLAQWPHDQQAAERIELLCKRLERWEDLVAFYQERLAAASSPSAIVPLCWAIAQVAERKLRDIDLAVQTYESLLEVVPGNLDVLRALARLFEATKQWGRLVEVSEREVKLTEEPDKKAHVYFKLGSIHETIHQDLERAIECYESAVELDAQCVPALHGLREIYKRQGAWAEVIQTLEREARLWDEPREKASVHTMIAEVYRDHLGDLERAERHVEDALRLAGNFAGALKLQLDLFMTRGRWQEAAEVAARLTREGEGRPSTQRADVFYTRARIALHLDNPEEAAAALRIALDLDPTHMSAFDALLGLLEGADDRVWGDPEGKAFLDTLERRLVERGLTEGLVRLTIHRGRLCERALELEQALTFYAQAARLAPTSGSARRSWAALLVRLRRFDDAVEVWRSMHDALTGVAGDRRVGPRGEALLEMGGLYLDRVGSPRRGLECFEQVLALVPAHKAALFGAARCGFLLGRWELARDRAAALLAIEEAQGHVDADGVDWGDDVSDGFSEALEEPDASERVLGSFEVPGDEGAADVRATGDLVNKRLIELAAGEIAAEGVDADEAVEMPSARSSRNAADQAGAVTPLALVGASAQAPPAVDHRRELAEHHFFHGRILEIGFEDHERALLAYSRAKNLWPDDIRPVVASARILHRQGNWLRLDNILRAAIQAGEVTDPRSTDGADGDSGPSERANTLRLLLASSCADRGEVDRARSICEEVVAGSDGALKAAAKAARVALLARQEGDGASVDRALADAPADGDLLSAALARRERSGDPVGAFALLSLLDALGLASDPQRVGLNALTLERPGLGAPLANPVEPDALRQLAPDALKTSLGQALGVLEHVLAAAFPTRPDALTPAAIAAPEIAPLRDEIARLLGAQHLAERLVAAPVGPEGVGTRAENARLAGAGAEPLGLVKLAFEAEPDAPAEHALRAARFAIAVSLERLRGALSPCLSMSLADLGHCVEIIEHLMGGGASVDLDERDHLFHALGRLRARGLEAHVDALAALALKEGFTAGEGGQGAALVDGVGDDSEDRAPEASGRSGEGAGLASGDPGVDAAVLSARVAPTAALIVDERSGEREGPAGARWKAERLLEAVVEGADRVGLLLCGDVGAAIDALCALETGGLVALQSAEARRRAVETIPRVRRLASHCVAAPWAALLDAATADGSRDDDAEREVHAEDP